MHWSRQLRNVPSIPLPRDLVTLLEAHFDTRLDGLQIVPGGLCAGPVAALASGLRIYFAPGRYNPRRISGIRMIAHEIAHLIQQGASLCGRASGVLIDSRLECQAEAAADGFMAFLAGDTRARSPLRGVRLKDESKAAQPFIVNFSTMFGKGKTVENSITVRDALRLQLLYGDNSRDFDAITNFSEEMNTSDVLVLNAHGSSESLDKMSASNLVKMLVVKSFKGCSEVHVYACECGKSIASFGQQLADALYLSLGKPIPVWAAMGNVWWDEDEKRYKVEKDKYSEYSKGSGWLKCTPILKSEGYGSMHSGVEGSPTIKQKGSSCLFSIAIAATGLCDQGFELGALRHLRDTYVLSLPCGSTELARYTRSSASMIPQIDLRHDAEEIYRGIVRQHVRRIAAATERDVRFGYAAYRQSMELLASVERAAGSEASSSIEETT